MAIDKLVDIVDLDDQKVGEACLRDCLKKGLLHRSIMVFLKNSDGQILLQRRNYSDEWFPSYWTVSCTGHVKSGESPSEASRRELKEELGLSASPNFIFKFRVGQIENNGLIENELAHVFEITSDDALHLSPEEVAEGVFLSQIECEDFFEKRKNEITPDALLAFQRYTSL